MEIKEWKDIEEKIKNIKYPLVFIFSIFKLHKSIDDNQLSNILRFFFKYHGELALDYPLINIIGLLDNSYKSTIRNINSYYNLISDKISFCYILIKFRKAFKYRFLWTKDIKFQLTFLNKFKIRFLSYFDMNYNRKPFHIKNLHSFYRNNQEIINESIIRLKGIFKLFGQKFFIEYNILYLTNNQYINFDYREKTKYLIYIFQKLSSILDNIINIYKLYILTHKQLKNIINPNFKKCLIIKESEDENSITDSDVSFLIEN